MSTTQESKTAETVALRPTVLQAQPMDKGWRGSGGPREGQPSSNGGKG